MLKLLFKFTGLISLICFFIVFFQVPSYIDEDNSGAEDVGTLPLLSVDPSLSAGGDLAVPDQTDYGSEALIPCTVGLFVYYNQADPRWADALYGTSDLMRSHGCGPTALAMVVSSFSTQTITPLDAAVWASENGYCSRGEGSKHALIPDGLTHYGLTAAPLNDRSTESVLAQIRSGNVVIALMNKGYFTNGGHFLILTQVTENGKIRIADPASWKNSCEEWDPEFILSQVRSHAEAGGPLWVAGLPAEN